MSSIKPLLPDGTPPKRPHWTLVSVVLFVIGMLILIPSGLCTGVVGLYLLADDPSQFLEFLVLILPYGAIPMALGAGLVYAGLKSRRHD